MRVDPVGNRNLNRRARRIHRWDEPFRTCGPTCRHGSGCCVPFGKRPFRVHIDPTHDGAEVSFAVIDRTRTEMLHRVGLDELLVPAKIAPEQRTN